MRNGISTSFLSLSVITLSLTLALAGCMPDDNADVGKRKDLQARKAGSVGQLAPAPSVKGEPQDEPKDDGKGKPKPPHKDDGGKGEAPDTTDEEPIGKDDGGKGDGDTPAQNPTDGGDGGKDDGGSVDGIEPEPVKPCVYLDPAKPDFVLTRGLLGPNLPPIDVPSSSITGALQGDGETYIGEFTLFQENHASQNFMPRWDGKAGRIPYDYTFVVRDASSDKCRPFIKFVKQDPRTLNGCFDLNTRIRMADGTELPIAAIGKGDLVWNPVTRTAVRVAEVVKGLEDKTPMIEIGFAGRRVLVTETHPMLVKGALKQAKDVTTADYMYDERGVIHRVTLAGRLPLNPRQMVVNVRLESAGGTSSEHMVLADGIVSGDLHLQRKLSGQRGMAASSK